MLLGLAAASLGGCRRQGAPAPPPPVAAQVARQAAPQPVPFTHPLLARAERPISNEDCSRGALWALTQEVRALHKEAHAALKGRKLDPGAASCLPPAGEDVARMVRGPLLEHAGGCVGRDGPYDPEWDTVNSAVLSLGACLDCARTPEQRGGDCKHAIEAVDRAASSVQRASPEQRMAETRSAK